MHLLQLLHHNVDAVERRLNGMQGGSMIIKYKDFRIIQLDISNPDKFLKVATTVENLSSLGKCMLWYAAIQYSTLHYSAIQYQCRQY
jgi:hypothetical protein